MALSKERLDAIKQKQLAKQANTENSPQVTKNTQSSENLQMLSKTPSKFDGYFNSNTRNIDLDAFDDETYAKCPITNLAGYPIPNSEALVLGYGNQKLSQVQYEPLFNEDGTPLLNPDGSQAFKQVRKSTVFKHTVPLRSDVRQHVELIRDSLNPDGTDRVFHITMTIHVLNDVLVGRDDANCSYVHIDPVTGEQFDKAGNILK